MPILWRQKSGKSTFRVSLGKKLPRSRLKKQARHTPVIAAMRE
jgi:hypothetical protein